MLGENCTAFDILDAKRTWSKEAKLAPFCMPGGVSFRRLVTFDRRFRGAARWHVCRMLPRVKLFPDIIANVDAPPRTWFIFESSTRHAFRLRAIKIFQFELLTFFRWNKRFISVSGGIAPSSREGERGRRGRIAKFAKAVGMELYRDGIVWTGDVEIHVRAGVG